MLPFQKSKIITISCIDLSIFGFLLPNLLLCNATYVSHILISNVIAMPKIRIRDIHLYYEIAGQGQSLLFIHGLGSSVHDWEAQVPFFSKQYQVVTFDVRGHGKSDKPTGPYSIQLFALDTAELIKSLRIDKTHVIGISIGGMIAFELAIKAPDLVRNLVIVNSRPDPMVRTLKERFKAFQRLLIIHLLGIRKIAQIQSKRLFPDRQHKELRRLFVERRTENDKQAYLDSLRAIYNWSVTAHLGAIRCPVLVIAGDKDYRPISEKEAYVAKMPRAELVVITNSRHATHMERPDQFNQVVIRFLSRSDTNE